MPAAVTVHIFDSVNELEESEWTTRSPSVRGFNRYYTSVIGALGEGHLHTQYTLTEARVLYELAQHDRRSRRLDLRRGLSLDAGYLTRILTRFDADGLITRRVRPPTRGARSSR